VPERLDIPIATMTLARDDIEARRLASSLERLVGGGRRVFVADGGSARSFLDALARMPVTLVEPAQRGLVGQIAASLAAAARTGARHILYTEPDKALFFDAHLDAFLAAAPRDAGIVLAVRSDEAFATFPRFQQQTERTFNDLCAEVVGERTDFLYGPFLLDAALVPAVPDAGADAGWGWRPFLFSVARHRGYHVTTVAGDFVCPPGERHEEERAHRLRQLAQNALGLARSLGR
jgi:hypothetical protein